MQMCEEHWVAMREGCVEAGLESYMTGDGDKAIARLKDAYERGKLTLANFEPVLVAHNMIVQNAINNYGLAVMEQEGCPLCWMTKYHAELCRNPNCDITNYDHWVEYAVIDTVDMLERVKEEQQA